MVKDLNGTATDLRYRVLSEWKFDPLVGHLTDALVIRCRQRTFDPVCDYLAGLEWDGVARIGTWLIDYWGAEDTPLNRAIGRKMLVATRTPRG